MARLSEPLDLEKLTEKGLDFKIDTNYVKDHYEENSDEDESSKSSQEKILEHSNKECVGVFDEDTYEEGEPFKIIGEKMTNLTANGKIKKRVIREGTGEPPKEYASVKIHYNAYVEFDDQPFDSTYVRNKPRSFVLNDGRVIPGLDFSVQSMKSGEKSQFLIHPDYAYGKNSFIGRIPPNATVLFEVELLEIVESGAAITYENLTEDQQMVFQEIYKYSIALCEKAKKLFMDHDYKKAIREYNTAACKLESADPCVDEVESRRQLLVRIYSNLLISYTHTQESRKGCLNAKKIYDITSNGELMAIPAKVYFNHARCLRFLGEYAQAKTILDKAYRLEPNNPDIANEMLNLENEKTEHKKQQELYAKALVGNLSSK